MPAMYAKERLVICGWGPVACRHLGMKLYVIVLYEDKPFALFHHNRKGAAHEARNYTRKKFRVRLGTPEEEQTARWAGE